VSADEPLAALPEQDKAGKSHRLVYANIPHFVMTKVGKQKKQRCLEKL
jgi:hypothetical protein